MSAPQQLQWRDVQPALAASGQPIQPVPFAHYEVHIGAFQGGALNFAAPSQQAADHLRPHPQPPRTLPRPVPGFLDRDQEQGQIGQALARRQSVDLHGLDGTGKTALIAQVLSGLPPSRYPDGMVYLRAEGELYDDLLQDLLKQFYDVGKEPVHFTENEVRRHLAAKQALIAVDDANGLDESQAGALLNVAPRCALLVAGREQKLWQGAALSLGGLPPEQAVALFERTYGRATPQDRPTVEAICRALGDSPKAILKTASLAAQRGVPLAQALHEVQAQAQQRDPLGQATWMLGFHLSEGERFTLAGLAAPAGQTVAFEALAYITQLDPAKLRDYLSRLQKMDLVHATDGRYALDEGLRPHIAELGVDEEMRARAAHYYLQQAGQLRPHSKDPDEANVAAALDYFYQRGQWREVIQIARSMDRYLATSGRWGSWRQQLEKALHAARQVGDRATEAWAQNQLGIIAVGAGSTAAAQSLFRGALALWQALGDRHGETIARWNLQLLLAPPPPPHKAKPEARPGGGRSPLPAILGGVTAVLFVALAVLIGLAVRPDRATPLPPPLPATTRVRPMTVVAPPTTVVPPEVHIRLAGGCGTTFTPGQDLGIQVWSRVDGNVVVSWVSPAGGREPLFEMAVRADQTASRLWDAPGVEGRWLLEADLNGGQATGRCDFAVVRAGPPADSLPPTIEQVWLEPVEEHGGVSSPVCPGDQVWVYATVMDDRGLSRVELASRPVDGYWSSAAMEAVDDRTYRYPIVASEEPGTEFYVYAEDLAQNSQTSARQVYAVEPCFTVLYDFVEMAPQARWTGYTPDYPNFYGLEFPGDTGDERGFALWQYDATLEDGGRPDHRILETHPAWVDGGAIWGEYNLSTPPSVVVQAGDRFVARVGFLSGAGAGEVTFQLRWWSGDPDGRRVTLGELNDAYDSIVKVWIVPLDSLAGQSGYFSLVVEAGETSAQDWAVWVEARLERP